MNKKGIENSQLLFITWLIINIIIFFSLFYIVDRNLSEAGSLKQFLARDFSLLINTLYSTNGNIEINYTLNHAYELSFKDSNVKIRTSKLVDFPESYSYSANRIYKDLDQSIENYNTEDNKIIIYNLTFKKSQEGIEIEKR